MEASKKVHKGKQQEQSKNKENEITVQGVLRGEFLNYGFPNKTRAGKEDNQSQGDIYHGNLYKKMESNFQYEYHHSQEMRTFENHSVNVPYEKMTDGGQMIGTHDHVSPGRYVTDDSQQK